MKVPLNLRPHLVGLGLSFHERQPDFKPVYALSEQGIHERIGLLKVTYSCCGFRAQSRAGEKVFQSAPNRQVGRRDASTPVGRAVMPGDSAPRVDPHRPP